jgi:hypothetical protein
VTVNQVEDPVHVPDPGQQAPGTGRICGQCGEWETTERIYCQRCESLLPDPSLGAVFAYSTDDDTKSRRRWIWLGSVALAGVMILAAAWLTVQHITEPEPQETLATRSASKALASFDELNEAQDLAEVRHTATAGAEALVPVVEMLSEISSDNDTRPRLDAYRNLFRGFASLAHITEHQPQEWSAAKQRLQSGLSGLAEDDPQAGLLRSQGDVAIDAVQDQIDAIERSQRIEQDEVAMNRAARR